MTVTLIPRDAEPAESAPKPGAISLGRRPKELSPGEKFFVTLRSLFHLSITSIRRKKNREVLRRGKLAITNLQALTGANTEELEKALKVNRRALLTADSKSPRPSASEPIFSSTCFVDPESPVRFLSVVAGYLEKIDPEVRSGETDQQATTRLLAPVIAMATIMAECEGDVDKFVEIMGVQAESGTDRTIGDLLASAPLDSDLFRGLVESVKAGHDLSGIAESFVLAARPAVNGKSQFVAKVN